MLYDRSAADLEGSVGMSFRGSPSHLRRKQNLDRDSIIDPSHPPVLVGEYRNPDTSAKLCAIECVAVCPNPAAIGCHQLIVCGQLFSDQVVFHWNTNHDADYVPSRFRLPDQPNPPSPQKNTEPSIGISPEAPSEPPADDDEAPRPRRRSYAKPKKTREVVLSSERHESRSSIHQTTVRSIAFHPSGQVVASGSADGSVVLWDARLGEVICNFKRCLKEEEEISCVRFTSDGVSLFAASEEGQVLQWTIDLEKCWTVRNHTQAAEVSVGMESPEFPFPMAILKSHHRNPQPSTCAVFGRDAERLVLGYFDGSVKLQQASSGVVQKQLTVHPEKHVITCISLSPDMRLLATSSASCLKIHELATGSLIKEIETSSDVVSSAFSPTGSMIAVGGRDGTLCIRDGENWSVMALLRLHHARFGSVTCSQFSSDEKMLFFGCEGGSVMAYSLKPPVEFFCDVLDPDLLPYDLLVHLSDHLPLSIVQELRTINTLERHANIA